MHIDVRYYSDSDVQIVLDALDAKDLKTLKAVTPLLPKAPSKAITDLITEYENSVFDLDNGRWVMKDRILEDSNWGAEMSRADIAKVFQTKAKTMIVGGYEVCRRGGVIMVGCKRFGAKAVERIREWALAAPVKKAASKRSKRSKRAKRSKR
jgi:hypothetical protein